MTERIEQIISTAYKTGVIDTLSSLGLLSEKLSASQAEKEFGRRLIKEWRMKRWIVGYPTGNKQRGKVYYLRAELERARRMLDLQNMIPENKIIQMQKL
ncbi:MAG: hypothetical protein GX102_04750 [Porphyromonadaceae bacterium]|jgi:hypothetical protein|nr:hypothetical protein [Porphyromonadaceae bacterium]